MKLPRWHLDLERLSLQNFKKISSYWLSKATCKIFPWQPKPTAKHMRFGMKASQVWKHICVWKRWHTNDAWVRVWEESEKPLFPKKTRDLISQTYSVSRARPRVTVDSETLHPSVILAAEMKRMEPSMRSSWNLDDQVIALHRSGGNQANRLLRSGDGAYCKGWDDHIQWKGRAKSQPSGRSAPCCAIFLPQT